MKTYHLVHIFSTFMPGGPQVRTSQVVNSLPEQFRHTIIAMNGNLECRQRIAPSANVTYLESLSISQKQFTLLHLKKILLSLKPDLLLTYNWGAIEAIPASILAGVRACLHAEDGFGPDEVEKLKIHRVWARRFLLRLVSGVVVPSLNLVSIAKNVWRVPDKYIHYIPNGVSTNKFAPGVNGTLRQELGIKPSDCVFGTVAHLRAEKNLSLLISSFAQTFRDKAAYLMLVGDGPEKDKLSKLVEKLDVKNKVLFIGHVENTSPYYQAMNIFVLSSITEQMPITLLEAMSSGLPVVSTDVGDIKQMVCDDNKPFIFSIEDKRGYREGLLY